MKRTAYALLICVGIVGIVLAVTLNLEKQGTPQVVTDFFTEIWGGDAAPILKYGHKELQYAYSPERVSELFRRFSHQLGKFVRVKQELGRTTAGVDRTQIEVTLECEKANTHAWVELKRHRGGWQLTDFEITVPERLSVPGSGTDLNRLVADILLSFVQKGPRRIYDHFSPALRKEHPFVEFKPRWEDLNEQMTETMEMEPVGEPTATDDGTWQVVHRAARSEGGYLVIKSRWAYRGLYWQCVQLDIEQTES